MMADFYQIDSVGLTIFYVCVRAYACECECIHIFYLRSICIRIPFFIQLKPVEKCHQSDLFIVLGNLKTA